MNLRDRKNLESAQKRCAAAAQEAQRAADMLAGIIKRANAAADADAERKAAKRSGVVSNGMGRDGRQRRG